MTLQFVSDLHLRYCHNRAFLRENPLEATADVLVLAGDIVSDKQRKKAEPFYELWRSQFKLVISIFGNHEFYNGTPVYAYPRYKKQLAQNHWLVNNEAITYENACFLCTTLWSHVPQTEGWQIEQKINDYHHIYRDKSFSREKITTKETNAYHQLSLNFLYEAANEPSKTNIVISHHLPSEKLIVPKWQGSEMRYAYASNLDDLIKKLKADLWIFGHQHESIDEKIGHTRFVANPLGYVDTEEQKKLFRLDWKIQV